MNKKTTYQIKLYFYNKKNSVVPSYYLFNQIDLFKNNNDFNTQFDISSSTNTYTNEYLKFNILINKEYYILFLYGDTNSFLENFNELIFVYNTFTFKIFKIENPNGNQLENKSLFYICFQNLKELNIFMIFIKTSKIDIINSNLKLSNYFNIQKSITFYNYYNLNNFWVINDDVNIINRYKIIFSINNLYINQIYLYGNLFIECII